MASETPLNGRIWRYLYDGAMLVFVIGLAFYAGKLTQRIEGMSQRGGVQISMEADRRLADLEASKREHERRIDSLERK